MFRCKTFPSNQKNYMKYSFTTIFFSFVFYCTIANPIHNQYITTQPTIGAAQFNIYLSKLKNKKVALVVNHTSMVGKTHLVDTLLSLGVQIQKIFAPEHGFRGSVADGETINDGIDHKTKLPIISLYGNNKKPTEAQLSDIDVVIFDIQDVGCRFYTYLSTMFLVMDACADQEKTFVLLDRPNPNGHYFDGPILDKKFESFVGMLQIPAVHGLTLGEMAKMIVGENWLQSQKKLDLQVVKCLNYNHEDSPNYDYPIAPSPNLQTKLSLLLYPSLCFFEGTEISIGRGTDKPFMVYGNPLLTKMSYTFTPKSIPSSVNPPQKDKKCFGKDLSNSDIKIIAKEKKMNLSHFFEAYSSYPDKKHFFLSTNYIDKLYGSDNFRKMVIQGKTEKAIRATWEQDLKKYKTIRSKYLIYP